MWKVYSQNYTLTSTDDYNLGKLKENITYFKLPCTFSTGFWIKESCSSLFTDVSLLFLVFRSKLSTLIFIKCTGWFIMYTMLFSKSNCFNWFEDSLCLIIHMMAIAIPTRSAIAKTTITAIMIGVPLQLKKIRYSTFYLIYKVIYLIYVDLTLQVK